MDPAINVSGAPPRRGLTIRGEVGQIRWSYFIAAAVQGYRVRRLPDDTWRLRGTVVAADAFKLAQRPLVFVAPHERGAWRWPIVDLDLHAGALTARLGPPVE